MNWLKNIFGRKDDTKRNAPRTVSEFATFIIKKFEVIDEEYKKNPSGADEVQRLMEDAIKSIKASLFVIEGRQFLEKIIKEVTSRSNKHGKSLARVWEMDKY